MARQNNIVRAYLSRERSGQYMLTYDPPVLMRVGDTEEKDFYVRPGDGVGFRHICPWAAKAIWGVELEPLQSIRVLFYGEVVG
jgi:hypothetical protein